MENALCSIEDYIQNKNRVIENYLDQLISDNDLPYRRLFQAARYSLLEGGKRLRPLLTFATVDMLKGSWEQAIYPACALEMIHTYSLIHDDLPCMDDDDFRRGKPSLHKAFSESHAVLAGDFLLTYAFECLANAPDLTAQQKNEIICIVARNAGANGMIGGQIMDIEAEDKRIEIGDLQRIHKHKTGALLQASIECGAVVAQAEKNHIDILKLFGEHVGLAFQIIDDVLDVTNQKNSDAKNGKTTYVSLLGIEEAQRLADSYYAQGLLELQKLPYDTHLLASIAHKIVHRKK
ncbi:MAG: hypothetical protein BGO14_05690 [Chlamydiales bacterium 38-26]|nr:polyprenyl synthetase family protein [Chlamydiales bacterium]OJV08391.1 MAG: hypothetical protein BGO14_05690 [Chlamydiales bacterium 38-26]